MDTGILQSQLSLSMMKMSWNLDETANHPLKMKAGNYHLQKPWPQIAKLDRHRNWPWSKTVSCRSIMYRSSTKNRTEINRIDWTISIVVVGGRLKTQSRYWRTFMLWYHVRIWRTRTTPIIHWFSIYMQCCVILSIHQPMRMKKQLVKQIFHLHTKWKTT